VDPLITGKVLLKDIVPGGFERLAKDKSQLKILVSAHREYL
jgi:hypothetical protein